MSDQRANRHMGCASDGAGGIYQVGVQVKRSKYGVRLDHAGKAARTMDNITFDSLKEMKRYADLKLLEGAGTISKLVLHRTFLLHVNGQQICKYICDFDYWQDGHWVIEDAKGMKTAIYRLKKKLMKAIHGIEIREV